MIAEQRAAFAALLKNADELKGILVALGKEVDTLKARMAALESSNAEN